MLGIGYILTGLLFVLDLSLFPYGGWILPIVSLVYVFLINEFINKKRLSAYDCVETLEVHQRLLSSNLKVRNKISSAHRTTPNVSVCIVPGGDAGLCLVGWRKIGVTEGALKMEPRVVEAALAQGYGHILNGDEFFYITLAVNFFGLFFLLLLNHFMFIAIMYLLVILLFAIGAIRFNIISVFLSERLTTFIRRAGNTILKFVLTIASCLKIYLDRHSDYLADKFSVKLGYGIHMKRFLSCYAGLIVEQGAISPLVNQYSNKNKRIIKIESQIRQQNS